MRKVEISLKDLLVAVSRHWVIILAVGLLFALAFEYLMTPSEKPVGEVAAYDAELDDLLIKQKTEAGLAAMWDPINYKTSFRSFSVHIDDAGMQTSSKVDLINLIANQHMALEKNASYVAIFADMVDTYSEEALRWMIKVNNESSIITIETTDIDGIEGALFIDKLFSFFEKNVQKIESITTQHSLRIVQQGSNKIAPKWVSDNHAVYVGKLNETERKIQALQEVPLSTMNRTVVGFIVGIVVGTLGSLVYYFSILPVILPDQIQRQLGIRYLGGVRKKESIFVAGVTSFFADSFLQKSSSQAVKVSAAILDVNRNSCTNIMLTGTVEPDVLSALAEAFAEEVEVSDTMVSFGGNLADDPVTIRMLGKADCVILVERQNASNIRSVYRLIESIGKSGKTIAGYVMV